MASGKDCRNSPYIELVKEFLEKEYRKTYLKPSRLYEWNTIYQEVENLKSVQKTGLMMARYLYIIYNMRGDFDTDQFKMKDFHEKMCNFFMGVGVNKKKLKSKNFVL